MARGGRERCSRPRQQEVIWLRRPLSSRMLTPSRCSSGKRSRLEPVLALKTTACLTRGERPSRQEVHETTATMTATSPSVRRSRRGGSGLRLPRGRASPEQAFRRFLFERSSSSDSEQSFILRPRRKKSVERDELVGYLAGVTARLVLVDGPSGLRQDHAGRAMGAPEQGRKPRVRLGFARSRRQRYGPAVVAARSARCSGPAPSLMPVRLLGALRVQAPDFAGEMLPLLVNALACAHRSRLSWSSTITMRCQRPRLP